MTGLPAIEQFRAWLEVGDRQSIRDALDQTHAADAAETLSALDEESLWAALQAARVNDAATVFARLPLHQQKALATFGKVNVVATLLDRVPADDRADLFKALDEPLSSVLLTHLSVRQRLDTERLVDYDEDTVGAVMSTEYAAVPSDMLASEALDFVRREAPRKETVYAICVIDEQGRLCGVVSLRDIFLSDPDRRLDEIMDENVICVRAEEPRTNAAEKIRKYDFLALPVINNNHQPVGIVTVDDALDVEEEEATRDFQRMAPVGIMKTGLKDTGLVALFRARVPWLLVLVFMNIFSGAGIAYFEDTLAAMISLAFFLPLLIDSGGNAGSQAAILMVRALATGDVRLPDWLRLLGKEFGVALGLGLSMGLAVALIASVRAPDIMLIVASTMLLTVLFGSLIGMSLPFVLVRLGFDPATASAPLVTSIADIGGVLIYFSIATWWLGDVIAASMM